MTTTNPNGFSFGRNCRNCNATIWFKDDLVSATGKRIPLNSDSSRHSCVESDDEYKILQAISYIANVNLSLKTCQLRLYTESSDKE